MLESAMSMTTPRRLAVSVGTYRNRHARRVDAVLPMPGDEMSDAQSTRSVSVRSESDVYRAVWNTVKGSMGNLVE